MDEIVIPSSLKWFVYQEFHKKHSPSSLRNMLRPSKVKSLLAKHGKRYQALNRHWVPLFSLTTTKKEQHATPHAPLVTVTSASLIAIDFLKLDKSADKIWLLSSYNRSVHEMCTCISYYKQVCRMILILCWNVVSDIYNQGKQIWKQTVWRITEIFWKQKMLKDPLSSYVQRHGWEFQLYSRTDILHIIRKNGT